MSAVTRPRGPLPARVYWTRRAVLLGVAFLMVFGVARLLGGGSDGKSEDPGAAANVAGAPTSTGSTKAAVRRSGTARPADDRESRTTRKPLAEADGPCDPEELVVEGLVSRVGNDGEIRIPLELRTSVAACTFSATNQSLVVKIVSGRDHIWSTQDCRGIEARDVVVRAERPARAVLVWNGRRSDVACGSSAQWALPGDYHVIAAALGGEPTDVQFELTAGPRERITVSPDPKKDGKKSDDAKPSERQT